jgi:hypothetical protein
MLATTNNQAAGNRVRVRRSGEAGKLGSISPSIKSEGVGPPSRSRGRKEIDNQREDGRKGRCFAAAAHDREGLLLLPKGRDVRARSIEERP